jgi:two-component system, NarL family, nitrate/nitrite response regulator NarL
MSTIIRVVVADDHPLFRAGLIAAFDSTDDIVVVGQAADGEGACRLVREETPDVAVVDDSMPGGGAQAAGRIASTCPATRVIVLVGDESDLPASMDSGVWSHVLKDISGPQLIRLVRWAALGGELSVPPRLASAQVRQTSMSNGARALAELTQRDRQVLELLAHGLTNQEIAARLGLTNKTISRYVSTVLMKLGVRSRLEAALLMARESRHQTEEQL